MVKLHSVILGEGKPMIILHGFLGMSDNWKTLGGKFAEEGYEVHLLDQRNHGRSPHTPEMSFEAMAKDVKNYCEEKGLDKIVLIGHSMGGKVGMHVAGDYPSLVEKLVVVDIAPKYYSPHHQQILDGLTALEEEHLTSRRDAEEFLSQYIRDEGTRLFLLKNLYWKNKELALRLNLKVLKEKYDEVGAPLRTGMKFEKDTLFIKGEKSNYITTEDTALIELHFPQASIIQIDGAGHWVHAEKSDAFFQTVMDFL